MSVFDSIQKVVFTAAETVFGDAAVWTPSDSETALTENVLYNSPDRPISIGSGDRYEYRPYNYFFEYTTGQFPTLKTLVDGGGGQGVFQKVTVKGDNLVIREVRRKNDGQTYIAYGELDDAD